MVDIIESIHVEKQCGIVDNGHTSPGLNPGSTTY